MGPLEQEVQRRLREPMDGTLVERMTRAHTQGVSMDMVADSTPDERLRFFVGSVFGLTDAVMYLAAEVERLSAQGQL